MPEDSTKHQKPWYPIWISIALILILTIMCAHAIFYFLDKFGEKDPYAIVTTGAILSVLLICSTLLLWKSISAMQKYDEHKKEETSVTLLKEAYYTVFAPKKMTYDVRITEDGSVKHLTVRVKRRK